MPPPVRARKEDGTAGATVATCGGQRSRKRGAWKGAVYSRPVAAPAHPKRARGCGSGALVCVREQFRAEATASSGTGKRHPAQETAMPVLGGGRYQGQRHTKGNTCGTEKGRYPWTGGPRMERCATGATGARADDDGAYAASRRKGAGAVSVTGSLERWRVAHRAQSTEPRASRSDANAGASA